MKSLGLMSSKLSALVGGGGNPSDALSRRHSSLHRLDPSVRVVSVASCHHRSYSPTPRRISGAEQEKLVAKVLASISSTSGSEMITSASSSPVAPPPPSYTRSPLLLIGVGVGLSAIFQVVTARLKRYALQQSFKTIMNQSMPPDAQFPFIPGSQFAFPTASNSVQTVVSPMSPQKSLSSDVNVDIQANDIEPQYLRAEGESQMHKPQEKQVFVDVTLSEIKSDHVSSKESQAGLGEAQLKKQVPSNATYEQEARASSEQTQRSKSAPYLSVEVLERMMEDPTVQKMVYPYLPEEMRNPATFKWMMQNPLYRQQLQDMLNNMGGNVEWDSRLTESLNNFDLSNPEIKQQFNQIGLTPEEVLSKIMENPDVALAFQNPKVQGAILDCSQNPLSIAKYQNDKEVMDVFTKISELFPGVTGFP